MKVLSSLDIIFALLLTVATVVASPAGPYTVQETTFEYDKMDDTSKKIDVVYPSDHPGPFPLLAFAHGFSDKCYQDYPKMMSDLASWGYVVAGSQACQFGCLKCKTLKDDPPCYGTYYEEQLKVIDWAKTSAAAGLPINHTAGVAIAGHSMGGQSTLFAAAYNASDYNIKAAVMQHAFTHVYPPVPIPFLTFTGTIDIVAPPKMAEAIFNAAGNSRVRGLINKVGANHHEPTSSYNPELAFYTVAFFKIFVEEQTTSHGQDWHSLIFQNTSTSLCGGGDGAMAECSVLG